jgi:hypothetical protein
MPQGCDPFNAWPPLDYVMGMDDADEDAHEDADEDAHEDADEEADEDADEDADGDADDEDAPQLRLALKYQQKSGRGGRGEVQRVRNGAAEMQEMFYSMDERDGGSARGNNNNNNHHNFLLLVANTDWWLRSTRFRLVGFYYDSSDPYKHGLQ